MKQKIACHHAEGMYADVLVSEKSTYIGKKVSIYSIKTGQSQSAGRQAGGQAGGRASEESWSPNDRPPRFE